MIIVFDHDLNLDGSILSNHFIDTSSAAVQAMLTSNVSTVANQVSSGYSVMSKHPTYPGKTRWQVILAEVVRLNDTTARTILGV